MTHHEIATLENAGRSAFAWTPEGYDGRTHYRAVLTALVPALSILSVAVVAFFAIL
jgi:hypothetical protein